MGDREASHSILVDISTASIAVFICLYCAHCHRLLEKAVFPLGDVERTGPSWATIKCTPQNMPQSVSMERRM